MFKKRYNIKGISQKYINFYQWETSSRE